MDAEFQKRIETAQAVAFVGEALAPFYLNDPRTGSASEAFAAIATLDPNSASLEWPFVCAPAAMSALSLMREGLGSCMSEDGLFCASDNLTDEYRRLFIGPAPKPAPPWGSVYTDRECVVFGESTIALRAWMRSKGIVRTVDDREPEDHIGLMLALMSHIARTQTSDLPEYLQLHLLTWAPHFLDELADAAENPFYRGLALLTKASLEGIRNELGIDVVLPRFYR